ncbi:MAG: M50 family metallopeptidase [Anaerolineales bacterium]|nr:M50 family metallopeptidase [Anaerolineales bacterium]
MKWLSSSWLVGRIRGMEIRLHFSMLFMLPVTYYIFRPVDFHGVVIAFSWLLGFVSCIFLHELGHALAAKLVGVEVKNIVLWLLGGFTSLSRKAERPVDNLAIFAAGPLVNMFLGFLFVIAYMLLYSFVPRDIGVSNLLWAQAFTRLFFSLAFVNVILVVFNLLPIYPLDGGNILHAAMEMFFGKSKADLITLIVSIPILIGLIILGLVTRDYVLLASCILIAFAMGTLNRSALHWVNLGVNYFFKRAGYYYLQGDFERAAQYYTRDIDREPQNANHYLARAACLLNILQKERAAADIERALKFSPTNIFALQLRGEIYSMEKNYDAALNLFARTQEISPTWAIPYFDRGSVFLDKKEYQPALAELNKAISYSPQTWLFYLIRSIAHFRVGDFEAAHKDQDLALSLSEKDSLVMTDLNMIVYENNLEWAEDYYGRAILKSPHSAYAYQGRADAYRINNVHDKAITDYTRAIELLPKESRLYLGRGKSYAALGETQKAESDFKIVMSITDKLHLKKQTEELLKNIQNDLVVE